MSLTKDDLQAIKRIVDTAVEDSKLHTAAGFAEVHEKIGDIKTDVTQLKTDLEDVKKTVNRIEQVQRAEVERVDEQSKTITSMKRKLKLA